MQPGQSGVIASGELPEGPLSLYPFRSQYHFPTSRMSITVILAFL
jgi:hypothetical protein